MHANIDSTHSRRLLIPSSFSPTFHTISWPAPPYPNHGGLCETNTGGTCTVIRYRSYSSSGPDPRSLRCCTHKNCRSVFTTTADLASLTYGRVCSVAKNAAKRAEKAAKFAAKVSAKTAHDSTAAPAASSDAPAKKEKKKPAEAEVKQEASHVPFVNKTPKGQKKGLPLQRLYRLA